MKVLTQRYYFDLSDHGQSPSTPGIYVLPDIFPVDFSGAVLCVENDSDVSAEITVGESQDGVTWNVVLFSTPTTSGNLSYTIVPRSRAMLCFVSSAKYVGFGSFNPAIAGSPVLPGVKAYIYGYPPDGARSENY